jgi:GNAT superfamily N-acetyltransferase
MFDVFQRHPLADDNALAPVYRANLDQLYRENCSWLGMIAGLGLAMQRDVPQEILRASAWPAGTDAITLWHGQSFVGMIVAGTIADGERTIWVQIEPGFRGLGLSRGLIAAAVLEFGNEGCQSFRAEVPVHSNVPVAFCEAVGFQAR